MTASALRHTCHSIVMQKQKGGSMISRSYQMAAGRSLNASTPEPQQLDLNFCQFAMTSQLYMHVYLGKSYTEAFTRPVFLQNGTTREVVNQLRAISTQQSRIRALRDRMAGLKAVAARQTENFAELLLVKRIPAAYREALCEVVRR